MMIESCGCENSEDEFGLIVSVSKCCSHVESQRDPSQLDSDYYGDLGFGESDPGEMPHVKEMCDAIGGFPHGIGRSVLEIGCGISPYAKHLIESGYRYTAVEPSVFAAARMREMYGVDVVESSWEDAVVSQYDLIVFAHCLEHTKDPVNALVKCRSSLLPSGELFIVVPEGTDRTNPDHLVFFTIDSLRECVRRSGMSIKRFAVAQHVPHERFLYCRATPLLKE